MAPALSNVRRLSGLVNIHGSLRSFVALSTARSWGGTYPPDEFRRGVKGEMAVTACGLGDQQRMIAVPRRCYADLLRARTSSSTARTARNGVSVASGPIPAIRAATEPDTESSMRTIATAPAIGIRPVERASSWAGGAATSTPGWGPTAFDGDGNACPGVTCGWGFLATPEQAG